MAKHPKAADGFVTDPDEGKAQPDSGGNEGTGLSQAAYDPRQDGFNPPADWDSSAPFQGDYGRSGSGSATQAGSGDYGSEAGRYSSSPDELGDPEGIDPQDAINLEDEGDIDSPEIPDEDVGAEPPVKPT
ncbi:hypothetical protein [Arenimonas sp. MALMAid1274]|uniref:hypothetical protein n=1 Tax=Arenimonas sp. MALMAid1274 TaxID=3411630 RepID=UPI003BA1DDB2